MDIDATVEGRVPDFKMIEDLAVECRMPLCYGGGIKTVEQAKTIIGLGVEKIATSSAIVETPNLIANIADEIGAQSVVAVLDIKKRFLGSKYEVWTHNAKVNTGKCPVEFSKAIEKLGVGEIVLNSIDNDGVMKGYDLTLIKKVRDAVNVPMSVVGGAGSLKDIGDLIKHFGIIGAAAGSLFVFKGVYKAVLINYPNRAEKDSLISSYLEHF